MKNLYIDNLNDGQPALQKHLKRKQRLQIAIISSLFIIIFGTLILHFGAKMQIIEAFLFLLYFSIIIVLHFLLDYLGISFRGGRSADEISAEDDELFHETFDCLKTKKKNQ